MTAEPGAFEDVTGAILVGGLSRRLGRDKILLPFRGAPLAVHLHRLLAGLFPAVLLVGHPRPELQALGLPFVEDDPPGRGILGGIYTALTAARTPHVFVLGGDMPFVTASLVERITRMKGEADAVIPMGPRGREPLCALYSTACAPTVRASLDRGVLKVTEALVGLAVVSPSIVPEDGDEDPFANINYPGDLAKLEG